jgi:ATP-dependent helicase/nuclease subunit B
VQIIYGPRYQALLAHLYKMTEDAAAKKENLLILVPAQASFMIERGIIEASGEAGFIHVEVNSFEKLVERLLEMIGGRTLEKLDQIGFGMLAKLALMDLSEEELRLVRKDDPVIHEKLAALVWALKSENITPQDLQEQSLRLENTLSEKLRDIADIYAAMETHAQDTWYTTLDLEAYIAKRFTQAAYIKKRHVVLFGFDVLPRLRMETICHLATAAKEMTLLAEATEEDPVFSAAWNNLEQLAHQVKEYGLPVEFTPCREIKTSQEIDFLFQNFYRYPAQTYEKTPSNISLTKAKTRRQEIEYVAEKILEYASEQAYALHDLAVITGNTSAYELEIRDIFGAAQIPFFIESKRALSKSLFAQFVLQLLRIVAEESWKREDIFLLLRSGFCCTLQEADALTWFMKERGLRGYTMKSPLKGEDVEALEEIRARIFSPILELAEIKELHAFIEALYLYFASLGIEQKMMLDSMEMERLSFAAEANYLKQVYPAVEELFAQVKLLREISKKELAQVMEAGFAAKEISIIPPRTDEVLIADAVHSIIGTKKVIFVIGANEGILPPLVEEAGLITMHEVEALRQEIPAFPDRMRFEDQRRYMHKSFTLGEQLYITYNEEDVAPSSLISRVRRIFPLLEETNAVHVMLRAKQAALPALAQSLQEEMRRSAALTEENAARISMYEKEAPELLEMVKTYARHNTTPEHMHQETAKQLYGGLQTSVSRIESYYECPYQYFVARGLRPVEIKEYAENPADVGTYVHDLMDGFTKRILSQEKEWATLSDAQMQETLAEVAEELIPAHNQGIFAEARYAFMEQRLREEAVWAVKNIKSQLETQPNVKITATEAGFEKEMLRLPTRHGQLVVSGRIDRIDTLEEEEKTLLRVVDYKTGQQGFDLTEAVMGVGIQLLVYLMAAEKLYENKGETVLPAGGFYYAISLPYVKEGKEKERSRYMMRGFVTLEEAEGEALLPPPSDARIMKLTGQEVQKLLQHVRALMVQAMEEIYEGKIYLRPTFDRGMTPCRYCPYHAICMFDEESAAPGYRYITKVDKETFFEQES